MIWALVPTGTDSLVIIHLYILQAPNILPPALAQRTRLFVRFTGVFHGNVGFIGAVSLCC